MRGVAPLAALLLLTSLAGCLGGPAALLAKWQLPDGSPAPVAVADCQALLRVLNDRTLDETDTLIAQSLVGIRHHGWLGARSLVLDAPVEAAESAADGATPPTAPAASAAGADVTGTNNQEAGVDEADVLKTDGEWTYVAAGARLYILHSTQVGNLSEHARIESGDGHGGQLLLEPREPNDAADDRLVLITQTHRNEAGSADGDTPYGYPLHRPYTRVQVFDLADRSEPALVKELWLEGENVGARLVDGHAYIVAHAWQQDLPLRVDADPLHDELEALGLTWQDYRRLGDDERDALRATLADDARRHNRDALANATLADHLPRVLERGDNGTLVPRAFDGDTCRRVLLTEEGTGRSVSTVVALAVADDAVADGTTRALGSRPILYGAQDALVLAAPSRDAWWFWEHPRVDEATDLQWFDLDGLHVVPRASGRVPGIVQDSFGIDVARDTLRVATTTGQWGRWWLAAEEREPMMNHLVVLEAAGGELVPTGIVGGIAPGERIWSARFTDTRAYIITFEQIDPLWIIDLADKSRPRILGELEIPGVSTYIHPLSDELLLAIGYGPGADGLGLDRSRIQLSLFDLSDESRPTRAALHDLSVGDGWSHSGALHEHKAFTYWGRLGMLAVPLTTSGYDAHGGWSRPGLELVRIDEATKTLRSHGALEQGPLGSATSGYRGADIARTYFLGHPDDGIVSVYAMSRLGVTAHDLATLSLQDHVAFADDGFAPYGHLVD